MTFRLLQCSDFHLGAQPQDDDRRMTAVREHVQRIRPDLLVFTGDLVDKGPEDPQVLREGLTTLASFGVPFHVVPGNHDVGNKISIGKAPVTREAVAKWVSIFGCDRFMCERFGWRIIGLNSQITGTGWEEEAAQLAWLHTVIPSEQPTCVFMHMPPYLYNPNENPTGRDAYWQVDPKPRRELLTVLEQPNVHLIASGHVHWHAIFNDQKPMRLWAPACYSIVTEPHYPPGGDCTGMILYTLGKSVTYERISDDALSCPKQD